MLGVQTLEVYNSVRFVKGSMCFRGVPNALGFSAQNWRFEPTYNNRANTWQMEKRRKVFVQVVAASWELNVFSSMTYLDTSRHQNPAGPDGARLSLSPPRKTISEAGSTAFALGGAPRHGTCRSVPELSGKGIRNAGVFVKACYQEGTAAKPSRRPAPSLRPPLPSPLA